MNIQPISGLDVIQWPCGTWCFREDLPEYTWLSDDYLVMPDGSDLAEAFLVQEYTA